MEQPYDSKFLTETWEVNMSPIEDNENISAYQEICFFDDRLFMIPIKTAIYMIPCGF
jgi:hypothetical protein